MIKVRLVIFSILLVVSVSYSVETGAQHADGLAPDERIPLDNKVTYGKLENGFTYYIRRNTEPQNTVVMHFVVKAGSDQEDQDQRHLAHLLEHMPFTGTVHFSNPWDYFLGKGLKRGVDINASTGGNLTDYFLVLPRDPAIIKDGLKFLRDCAHGILLKENKINLERGALLGEIMPTEFPLQSRYFGKLTGNLEYAEMVTTDSRENVKRFKVEALHRFYQDWYRPELQAVVVVGDIDENFIKKEIIEQFSDLKNPNNPRSLKQFPAFFGEKNQFILQPHSDDHIRVDIFMKKPLRVLTAAEDFKFFILSKLYNEMAGMRFERLRETHSRVLNSAASVYEEFQTLAALHTYVRVPKQMMKNGVQLAVRELERIKKYGFTQDELDKAKAVISAGYITDSVVSSSSLADDYIQHFVEGKAAPGIEVRNDIIKDAIENISLQEMNRVAGEWITDRDRDIVVLAPEREKESIPDEATVLAWFDEVASGSLDFHSDVSFSKPLMTDIQVSGLPVQQSSRYSVMEEVGVTGVTFSNGIKILFKPMEALKAGAGKILIEGFSGGGASLYSKDDYLSACYAASIVGRSGLGNLDQFELDTFLKKRGIEVRPYILPTEEGVRGSSAIDNFESLLQTIYLYFAAPKKDEAAFSELINSVRSYLENPVRNPFVIFNDTVNTIIHGEHNDGDPVTAENLHKIRLDRAYDIYRERFANAGEFTFVLTGDFDVSRIVPLVAKYLGSLPSTGRQDPVTKNNETYTLKGKVDKRVFGDVESGRADVQIHFLAPYKLNLKNKAKLSALRFVLEDMLMKRLREKEGGTYAVSVFLNTFKADRGVSDFIIAFNCAAENVEHMMSATIDEITQLKSRGPGYEFYQKAIVFEEKQLNENLNDSSFWSSYLKQQCIEGGDFNEIFKYQVVLDQLTLKDVKAAAKKYLDLKNVKQFVLLPEAKQQVQ